MFNPADYRKNITHADEARADAQRAWEREHECHRKDCDAAFEDTKACEGCGDRFCPVHLYDGCCAACFVIDEAADELIAAELRRAA